MTKFISLPAIALAAALILLGGCVPDEDDFKSDHPGPGSSSSSSGSSLTCASSLSGSGTFSSPAVLGTAPACFEHTSSIDVYYSVTIPTTGTWFFQIVDLTGDMDLYVYTSTTFSSLLDSSINIGTTDDVVTIDITDTGTGGIRVDNFDGGNNFYRLEVVQ